MFIRPFQHSDESTVIDLWRRCGLVRQQNESLGFVFDDAVSMGKRLERDGPA